MIHVHFDTTSQQLINRSHVNKAPFILFDLDQKEKKLSPLAAFLVSLSLMGLI